MNCKRFFMKLIANMTFKKDIGVIMKKQINFEISERILIRVAIEMFVNSNKKFLSYEDISEELRNALTEENETMYRIIDKLYAIDKLHFI